MIILYHVPGNISAYRIEHAIGHEEYLTGARNNNESAGQDDKDHACRQAIKYQLPK
jgi:hypothetical protein